jgi:hypothetical protein
MGAGCENEEPHVIPAFQPWAGREWDVVQLVAAGEHQTGDLVVTVEGDPVLPRRDYLVSLLSFAGVTEIGETGEVSARGFLRSCWLWSRSDRRNRPRG